MSYPLEVWEEAKRDIEALPERELQLAAVRAIQFLAEDPFCGKPLRSRVRVGDLGDCRTLAFDRHDRRGKPRYRLVYRNDPNDGSIAVVQVLAVGLREKLGAYRAAAARLRAERRRRLT